VTQLTTFCTPRASYGQQNPILVGIVTTRIPAPIRIQRSTLESESIKVALFPYPKKHLECNSLSNTLDMKIPIISQQWHFHFQDGL